MLRRSTDAPGPKWRVSVCPRTEPLRDRETNRRPGTESVGKVLPSTSCSIDPERFTDPIGTCDKSVRVAVWSASVVMCCPAPSKNDETGWVSVPRAGDADAGGREAKVARCATYGNIEQRQCRAVGNDRCPGGRRRRKRNGSGGENSGDGGGASTCAKLEHWEYPRLPIETVRLPALHERGRAVSAPEPDFLEMSSDHDWRRMLISWS